MSPASKETHRRIRRNGGLGLMVAWIVGWYIVLDPGSDGVLAQGLFGLQLLLILATAPFAFGASHIIGRNLADREMRRRRGIRRSARSAPPAHRASAAPDRLPR